jgi:L-aminopeptidase/D-esterase-like protein
MAGGIKGGLGTASLVLDSGITVGAIVAVNSLGSVVCPATGRPWEIGLEVDGEFGIQGKRAVILPQQAKGSPARSTTIGLVGTDAVLSKAQAKKIAQMAHDGMARAIRPSHTLFDGDTLFCLATCKKALSEEPGFFASPQAQAFNELGHAAANCMSRAIISGILSSWSLAGMIAFCDLEDR